MRAHRRRQRDEHDLATYSAWRTAVLMRQKKIPRLQRLLRRLRRKSRAEKDAILADVAAVDAEFDRAEAAAKAGGGRG
jgi:hypothetical protein